MTERSPDSMPARPDGYARLYGPLAVVSTILLFLPLLEDVVIVDPNGSTLSWDYGTLWEMAGNRNGGPAVLGIVLAVGLIVLLTAATFRAGCSWPLPVAIAGFSGLLLLMLVTKPGVGDPPPGLTSAGVAALVVGVTGCVLGVAHAVHAGMVRRR